MKTPKALKPYKIKVNHYQKVPPARMIDGIVDTSETLTGYVMGQAASNLEEMAYRSITKVQGITGVEFQVSYMAGRNMPGEIRPDFMVYGAGWIQPIQIDGTWVHSTAEAQETGIRNDIALDNLLSGTGALPTKRINELQMPDQAHSDRLFAEMLR
jgi:hypothetical protein